jgi:hypothetical protein
MSILQIFSLCRQTLFFLSNAHIGDTSKLYTLLSCLSRFCYIGTEYCKT